MTQRSPHRSRLVRPVARIGLLAAWLSVAGGCLQGMAPADESTDAREAAQQMRPAGVYPDDRCVVRGHALLIKHNRNIDALLLDRGGNLAGYPSKGAAADIYASFEKAVDAWRAAIDNDPDLKGNIDLRRTVSTNDDWAADMYPVPGVGALLDDDGAVAPNTKGWPVFDAKYAFEAAGPNENKPRAHGHHPDDKN